MLAEHAGAVPSSQGPSSIADEALAGADGLGVLLVPGGIGTRREMADTPFIDESRRLCTGAGFVASVCTGSALLAKAGVLDRLKAESNKRNFTQVVSRECADAAHETGSGTCRFRPEPEIG